MCGIVFLYFDCFFVKIDFLNSKNQLKEIIKLKEKENEVLANKVKECEHCIGSLKQKQIADKLKFEVIAFE